MKPWQHILLGTFLALISVAVIYLIAMPPRGEPIELQPPPTPSPILVDVSGAVNQPGVYALQPDSRVKDALAAAGGLSAEADLVRVNQAKKLRDGEKLIVPTINQTITPNEINSAAPGEPIQETSIEAGPVNVNTASQQELETLPGIGPSRAQDMITYRDTKGPFQTVEDLLNVPGIGEVTLERLKPLIVVE